MSLLDLSRLSSDLFETPLILILKMTMQVCSTYMDLSWCFTFLSSFFILWDCDCHVALYFIAKCILQIYDISYVALTIMARLQFTTSIDGNKLDIEKENVMKEERAIGEENNSEEIQILYIVWWKLFVNFKTCLFLCIPLNFCGYLLVLQPYVICFIVIIFYFFTFFFPGSTVSFNDFSLFEIHLNCRSLDI